MQREDQEETRRLRTTQRLMEDLESLIESETTRLQYCLLTVSAIRPAIVVVFTESYLELCQYKKIQAAFIQMFLSLQSSLSNKRQL